MLKLLLMTITALTCGGYVNHDVVKPNLRYPIINSCLPRMKEAKIKNNNGITKSELFAQPELWGVEEKENVVKPVDRTLATTVKELFQKLKHVSIKIRLENKFATLFSYISESYFTFLSFYKGLLLGIVALFNDYVFSVFFEYASEFFYDSMTRFVTIIAGAFVFAGCGLIDAAIIRIAFAHATGIKEAVRSALLTIFLRRLILLYYRCRLRPMLVRPIAPNNHVIIGY